MILFPRMNIGGLEVALNGWLESEIKRGIPAGALFGVMDAAAAAAVSEKTIVLDEGTPVSQQAWKPSCVGNGMADTVEILRYLATGIPPVQMSRQFPWYNARLAVGKQNELTGAYVDVALDQLALLGICSERLHDYDRDPCEQPDPIAYAEASANKISGWVRVYSDRLNAMDKSLSIKHPVIIAGPVREDFSAPSAGYKPNPDSIVRGGHLMVVTGRRVIDSRRQYRIRNSWGDGWADGGHLWADEDFIMEMNDIVIASTVPELKFYKEKS